jgi:hypothetical protein
MCTMQEKNPNIFLRRISPIYRNELLIHLAMLFPIYCNLKMELYRFCLSLRFECYTGRKYFFLKKVYCTYHASLIAM